MSIKPFMIPCSRYTVIEETAQLQADTPQRDFAYHYYRTRYDRLRGVLKRDFSSLRTGITVALVDSMNRNIEALPKINQTNRYPMAWSMNWYRLRDDTNKPWKLTEEQNDLIEGDFQTLRSSYSFVSQFFVFQGEDKDMLLIAMALELDHYLT